MGESTQDSNRLKGKYMNLLPSIEEIQNPNRKKIRVEIIGKGKECPKCQNLMDRRKHVSISQKELNKAYYYSEWDYCWRCKHVQHYDQFKVWNNNRKSRFLKEQMEYADRQHFLNNMGLSKTNWEE